MILGKYVEADIGFESLAEDIAPHTKWAHTHLLHLFKAPEDNIDVLTKRRDTILAIRRYLRKNPEQRAELANLFQRSAEIEKELEKPIEGDERVEEYYKQILWEKGSFGSFLNESNIWLEAANLWKVWLLPAITILIPVLIIVLPYIIVRFALGANLTLSEYWALLQRVLHQHGGGVGGNMIAGMLLPPWLMPDNGTISSKAQKWGQWGASVFMFGSSIWQQITLSRHLYTITTDMRKRGALLCELQTKWNHIVRILEPVTKDILDFPHNPEIPAGNTLQAFGFVWNHPEVERGLTTNIGALDMVFTFATKKNIGFPKYVSRPDKAPSVLELDNFYHPRIPAEKIITNSLLLDGVGNAIISGPNRGGKSTTLKGILVNVLLAQTVGICFARKMRLTPFKQIHTALSPSDTLGRLSLFEAEIDFAKNILDYLADENNGRALLVMDEIFHSTNAIDGEEASRIFLNKLYSKELNHHASLISTHYVELPRSYAKAKNAIPLCLFAKERDDKSLEYTYRVRAGINKLSSVREILKERGLLE